MSGREAQCVPYRWQPCAHAGDAALKLVGAGRELPICINEKRLAAVILSLIETACRAWH
jgi:hypothetical protein